MAFSVSGSAQQAEINVTPLIDVLLVLLIIFMVIVPIAPRGLASQVPDNAAKAAQRSLGPVSLRVLSGEAGQPVRYEVDGRGVDGAGLGTALMAELRLRADRAVYVSATASAKYGDAAGAVSAAKAAGASTVGLGRL